MPLSKKESLIASALPGISLEQQAPTQLKAWM